MNTKLITDTLQDAIKAVAEGNFQLAKDLAETAKNLMETDND
ncbi:hypothetical protein [Vibrio lentus]|nr:hypothetical protein [Vibrio lentus]